jgi:CheY-like chemotaxis protein
LIVIAIKLMVEDDEDVAASPLLRSDGTHKTGNDLWSAVAIVVIADVVMSLDNVVALAAAANGSLFFLAVGLVLSIPLLMWGSMFVAALLRRYPILITAGGALLGWIAGDIAASDPIIADWLTTDAPALSVAMPLLVTVFVLFESRIVEDERRQARLLRGPSAMIEAAPVRTAPASVLAGGEPPAEVHAAADGSPSLGGLMSRAFRRKTAKQPSAPELPTFAPPSVADALAAGALILLAEDNPLDQGTIKRALEKLGFAVETANDGRIALDRMTERRYGLLVTDLDMPNLDGFALTASVRAREAAGGSRLPIIGLAGYVSAAAVGQKCLEAGMDDCLPKPATAASLEAVVCRWLPIAATLRRPLTATWES